MKHYAKKILTHPLFSGSLLVVIGTNINNAIQYLYHPVMGRLLGVEDYGAMVATFSLIILSSIIPGTLNLVIVKFISSASSPDQLAGFFSWIYKLSLKISLSTSLILIVFSPLISSFLKIPTLAVVITSAGIALSIPVSIMRSALQGELKFASLVVSIIIESICKLALGSILVLMGLSLTGALLGVAFATIAGWIYNWFSTRKYFTTATYHPDLKPLFFFTLPVIVNSLASSSLFSSDVILAKHYLAATPAGIYASLAALGKIIIYAANPVSSVMFPTISSRITKKSPYAQIFFLGLALTVIICSGVLFVYKIFPQIAVTAFFGSRFNSAVPYLFLFGVNVSLFTLSAYITSFFLSINRVRPVFYTAAAALIQIIGINLFHTHLNQIIIVSVLIEAMLLAALCLETYFHYKINYKWAR